MKRIDMRGKRVGFWTFIERAEKVEYGRRLWKVVCECGSVRYRTGLDIRAGRSLSCGCHKTELRKKTSGKESPAQRHMLTKSRFYTIWIAMKRRCGDTGNKYYGGKGIKVLWEGFDSFKNDMYEGYLRHVEAYGEDDTQIDRIDSSGNYCKDNCRWATRSEQQRNKG